MISTLVLDLDGPLLDVKRRHYQCYSDIMREHEVEPVSMNFYWEMKRNRMDFRQLLALSHAADLCDEFLSAWSQRIEIKEYLAMDMLQNRAKEILGDWKRSGMRLLLATMRTHPDTLHWQLGELGIAHFLDEVIVAGGNQDGFGKAAGVKPHIDKKRLDEVVWIGDTEADVHAARLLKVKICALSCGLRNEAYLSSMLPDMMEPDLSAFACGMDKA